MKFIFSLFLLMCFATQLFANDKKAAHYLGIKPEITIEPYYNKGELDLNILPLVYERSLNKQIDFRAASILNLGFRETGTTISHYGFQLALPIFLQKKENASMPSKGIYLAPGLGVTRNNLEKHQNYGLWLEPGYQLLFDDKWAIMFGVQLGATHFSYDNGTSKWGNHFGIKVIFGKWF